MNSRAPTQERTGQQTFTQNPLPQEPANLAKRPEDVFTGKAFRDPEDINAKLKLATADCNLVSPVTRVAALPPGFAIAMSVVYVDPTVNDKGNGPDVFAVDGGQLALRKHVIDRISSALGVSWDAALSGRVDDGTNPHYCHYKAAGKYRGVDGAFITIQDEYELDLRADSIRQQETTNPKALSQMRKFILARACTGARTRAVSSVGVKRAYSPNELELPFIVVKLHFDGHSDDPEIRRMLARETARAYFGTALPALYANAPQQPARDVIDAELEDDDEPPVQAQQRQPQRAAAPAKPAEPPVCLPDTDKTPVTKADDRKLQFWQGRIQGDLLENVPPAEERPGLEKVLAGIVAEIKRRERGEKY